LIAADAGIAQRDAPDAQDDSMLSAPDATLATRDAPAPDSALAAPDAPVADAAKDSRQAGALLDAGATKATDALSSDTGASDSASPSAGDSGGCKCNLGKGNHCDLGGMALLLIGLVLAARRRNRR
jgi:hypothetical protein